MKRHGAQKGWITTNGRLIRGCWAEDPGGPRGRPEPGSQAASLDRAVLTLPTCPGPGALSLHQRMLSPHAQTQLCFGLCSRTGSVGAQRSVTSIQALLRGYGPSQALPVSQPRSLGFGTSQAFSLSPVMETLPCPYVPAGLPVSCPFLFPGLRILPLISCPRVEALTYSLSLRILCAPDSLPQCSGPSQSPCQSSV